MRSRPPRFLRKRRMGRRAGCASLAAPPPMDDHVGDQPLEFFIRLYKRVSGHLRLTRVMEQDPPQAFRLHMRGCGNGSMWVDVDFPALTSCIVTVGGRPSHAPIACPRGMFSSSI